MARSSSILTGALLILAIIAYLPVLRDAGFIWDDDQYVQLNTTLRSMDGLRRIWFEPGATPQYYPLTFTSFWLEYQTWQLNPGGYHVVNVLLHGINAVLLWWILLRLAVPGAWFAAAIFAVHPVYVESVAWITERKNVLSGFFYLSAALAYLRFDPMTAAESPKKGNWKWYAASVVSFVAALLSKTVTCSLPAALLLILWWKRGRIALRELTWLAPMFFLGLAFAAVTVWMEKQHVGATGSDWQLTFLERCLIAGRALWFYAGKLFWPSELTFIYPRWSINVADWQQYVFPLAAIGVIAVLWFQRHRLGRGPLVAVLFFAGTLVPALGFFDVYPMRFSFVADHFQYLASIGLIVLATGVVSSMAQNLSLTAERLALLTGATTIVLLGVLTFQQCPIYKGLVPLWTDTLAKNPVCWMAHYNLGRLLSDAKNLREAESHLNKAVALKPNLIEGHSELGRLCLVRGRYDEATHHLKNALRINDSHESTILYLGALLAARGEYPDAIQTFKKVLDQNPHHQEAIQNLVQTHQLYGEALQKAGNVEEAQIQFFQAKRLLEMGL